jgi:hypothetical protein
MAGLALADGIHARESNSPARTTFQQKELRAERGLIENERAD